MHFDETAIVNKEDSKICMNITNAQDYQPVDMGINIRGTPSKEKRYNFSPGLTVNNGRLCIPQSFYQFPDKGQFIIEYVLKSKENPKQPRSFVVTLEVDKGRIYNVTPTEREIFLPYCRDKDSESSDSIVTGNCQR